MAPTLHFLGLDISSYMLFISIAFLFASYMFRKNLMSMGYGPYAYLPLAIIAYGLGFGGSALAASLEHATLMEVLSGALFKHGFSVLGGIIAATVGFLIYARFSKTAPLDLLSAGVAPLFLGYAIGRFACLFSGDGCYGVASDLPWAMAFPEGRHPTEIPVHPTPIYESIMALTIFFFTQHLFKQGQERKQQLTLVACLFLGLGIPRFLVEFVRRNELYFGLSQAQWISIALMIGGLGLLTRLMLKTKSDRPGASRSTNASIKARTA